jgi:hypothetical protein
VIRGALTYYLPVVLGLTLSLPGCAEPSPQPAGNEDPSTGVDAMADEPRLSPSFDRGPPPLVPPVDRGGVRYEQDLGATEAEFGQVGGVLLARDLASGAVLWSLKVYPNVRRPDLEGDVQDVFFQSMTFDEQGRLLIENENGSRFAVDVGTRTVSPLP